VFDGDNVYIGGSENLISGSIYISNTLGTGIEIGGASSGFIRSVGFDGQTSASLGKAPGGFVIYSGSGNLKMGEDFLNGVGMQFIGDNDARHLIFTTDDGGLLDVKTDKFFIGTENTQFISGSDGAIEISSSIFHLNPSANGGAGSLVIGANATINADLTVDNLRTPASIGGVASTETNSSSSIKADGFARFVSASIGGWGITTSSIDADTNLAKPSAFIDDDEFVSVEATPPIDAGVLRLSTVKSALIVAFAPITKLPAPPLAEGFKWNIEELISIAPSEPLINCVFSVPMKNLSVLTSNKPPSSVVKIRCLASLSPINCIPTPFKKSSPIFKLPEPL
jgi:hypothetical protein